LYPGGKGASFPGTEVCGFPDDALQDLPGFAGASCPLKEEAILIPGFEIGKVAVHLSELGLRPFPVTYPIERAGI
jgi:hypothetical protein